MAWSAAPALPRMHLFEIDDQPWFPPFLRTHFQNALTWTWTTTIPAIQRACPADLCAGLLVSHLGLAAASSEPPYTVIDFCAGGGGPTPHMERAVNAVASRPVTFVLTDLRPNVAAWERLSAAAAGRGGHLRFVRESVDAAAADPARLLPGAGAGPDPDPTIFRLFNLAFHHFDDATARAVLKDTLATSRGFAVFELQDRSAASFAALVLFAVAVLALAPAYAVRHRAPLALLFSWLMPALPFALVFDGAVSSLRTRTPDEVEALARTCGAPEGEWDRWEMRSGRELHMWPCGYVNWIICQRVTPTPTRGDRVRG